MIDIQERTVSIIPQPLQMVEARGFFRLDPESAIIVTEDLAAVGQHLQNIIHLEAGFSPALRSVENAPVGQNIIVLTIDDSLPSLGDEGYTLKAAADGISIRAPKPAGVFYGIQTLRQLIQDGADNTKIVPAVEIQDKPRFKWRGLMLDTARHFYPVAFIKRFIDLLALHKMNVFHWHLTEDQGWRIEIKKYPKLHEIGSQRPESQMAGEQKRMDGKPHGGFYTQEEVREIISYAAAHNITVIPEIEMPGHSLAALAGYPELGCSGGPYEVQTTWGIKEDVYCAGNEAVFTFLEDVLAEVLDLFPSTVIHVGGDEVLKDRWRSCAKCQAAIKREGLSNEDELQSYFIQRIEKFLNAKGRQLIGWDEILEGGLAPNALVMSWRGIEGGIEAASAGHDVVMSPTSHCYFDYIQSKDANEPPGPYWEGAYLPLENVYAFEPVPAAFSAEQAKHILGVQGNIWTEYIASEAHLEYMTFPRGTALAEVAWSIPEKRDFQAFMERMRPFLKYLEKLDVQFRSPFDI